MLTFRRPSPQARFRSLGETHRNTKKGFSSLQFLWLSFLLPRPTPQTFQRLMHRRLFWWVVGFGVGKGGRGWFQPTLGVGRVLMALAGNMVSCYSVCTTAALCGRTEMTRLGFKPLEQHLQTDKKEKRKHKTHQVQMKKRICLPFPPFNSKEAAEGNALLFHRKSFFQHPKYINKYLKRIARAWVTHLLATKCFSGLGGSFLKRLWNGISISPPPFIEATLWSTQFLQGKGSM